MEVNSVKKTYSKVILLVLLSNFLIIMNPTYYVIVHYNKVIQESCIPVIIALKVFISYQDIFKRMNL